MTSNSILDEDGNFYVEILQHNIRCFLHGDEAPTELDDCSVEHLEKMIKEGYIQGDLVVTVVDGNTETEYRGAWFLERNRT